MIRKKFFKNLDIKKNDKILVSSDILPFLVNSNISPKELANQIIDELINIVGKKGTILFPTYNWDFCKGKVFDYNKTTSSSGALGNVALRRAEFSRTINPIYSFAVYGKDKSKICSLSHKSCFNLDSPFGYLIKEYGKNIFLNLDYKAGFTFCHVAEEEVNVEYRFHKKFKSHYINKNGIKRLKEFKMFVRDPKSGVKMTMIHKNFDNILIKNKALRKYKIDDFKIDLVDINAAYKLMITDLKKDKKIIYTI